MGKICYRCMMPTVQNGVCTRCGELEATNLSNGENALPMGGKLGKGRLTVGKKLGSGGFGVTYIAYDEKLKKRVALKEFMPNYLAVRQGSRIVPKSGQDAAYQKSMNSFMKEARALYELRAHPNIVHVISVFKENNTAYYTMEMLEGESLLNYLRRKKKITGNRAFQMLLPIMKAIQYVHSKKMIHRDISPDNIMLCDDPNRPGSVVPKLIDFGAAHVAIEGYSLSYPGVKKNGFSPLEQNWDGNTQGPWTDVYSFCATFYSAIVGAVPVSAQARSEEDKDPMKPPRELGADISPAMQDVLMKGLKLQYQERIQTMDQLIQMMSAAVERNTNSTVIEISQQVAADPKRPTAKRVFAWIVEVSLVLGTALFLWIRRIPYLLGLYDMPLLYSWLMACGAWFLLDLILMVSAGGTFGQVIFGLKARKADGEGSPSFGGALLYALLYATFGFPITMILGIIWLASGKNIGPLERMTGLTIGRRNEQPVANIGGAMVSRDEGPRRSEQPAPVQAPQAPPQPVQPPAQPPVQQPGQPSQHASQHVPPQQQQQPPQASQYVQHQGQPQGLAPGQRPPQRQPGVQQHSGQPARMSEPARPEQHQGLQPGQRPPQHMQGHAGQQPPQRTPSQQQQQMQRPSSGPRGGGPAAQLVCLKTAETAADLKGKAVTIHSGSRLGKNAQKADIVIPDKTVSSLHCSFRFMQDKGWMIKDEESTNGTFVNAVKLPAGGACPIRNGALIITGKETFEFKC